jgi:nanoRNase/pAp phosphatase (c-di-AMP/oligoRNAs hydrolase)
VEYRDNITKDACNEFGFEVEFEDCKCFVLYCTTLRSSLCFGDRINEYDMCIMVAPHADRCTIRLYSNGDVDVSEIAKKYGGGGHKGAGGFVTETIPEEFLPGGMTNG